MGIYDISPFCRVIPIGNEFCGFQSAHGDGLFHRLNGVNRLYYTREFAKTEEVLTTLSFDGVEAMKVKASNDPGLQEVWDEMGQLGFFYDVDSIFPYSIAWLLDDRAGIPWQLEAYGAFFSVFNDHLPLFHVSIRNADAIAAFCREIEQSTPKVLPSEFLSFPSPSEGDTDKAGPTIRVFSPLLGDESTASAVMDYLERAETHLTFEAPISEKPIHNPVLQRLEMEGFLPAFRVTLGADLILDPDQRRSAARMIARCLGEQSNREVNLRFERPSGFGSPDRLHRYFDGLEAFLDLLLDIDDDVSRLSLVQRASLCLLQSRNVDHFLEATVTDGALHLHHYFDGDFITAIQPSRERLQELRRKLLEVTQSPSGVNVYSNGDYQRFCPKNLHAAFSMKAEAQAQERALVDQRRDRIWNKLFGWLLGQFLQVSRENVEFGTPLRLDITKDRQAIYSPLYLRTSSNDNAVTHTTQAT